MKKELKRVTRRKTYRDNLRASMQAPAVDFTTHLLSCSKTFNLSLSRQGRALADN